MRFRAVALATTVGGTVVGPDVPIDGVATDTRELRRGQLFVPLVDQRDGHQFLAAAVAAGAPAYLTTGVTVPGATAVVVEDTALALLSVGQAARDRLGDRVVGVTGSVGKTTVKDLVAGALATTYITGSSPLSFNNEIGVPLTLANADEETEATVVEMGARGRGHIRSLCLIARPTVGIVTRVGLAHTEQLGSLEGVAAAKAELVESLPPEGTAILNSDDPHVLAMRKRTSAAVRTFGLDRDADVRATEVALDTLARPSFRLVAPEGSAPVRLGLHGPHQVANALAAAAAALVAGVPVAAVAEGLEGVGPPRWRMSVLATRSGATVVNDAYNANPTSTRAALESLAAMGADRRVAVLGEMAELGPSSSTAHREVADVAGALGVELVAYRTPSYGVPAVDDEEALLRRLGSLGRGDAVLVKASRSVGLESLTDALVRELGGVADPGGSARDTDG
jgi:UDP-N-acetylmuramoyl-tripeptide--D-alanyl-D-alanine ligase